MAPIFSHNVKNLKSSVENGTGILVTEKQYGIYSENTISTG